MKFKTVNFIFVGLLISLLIWNWKYSVPLWPAIILVVLYCASLVYGAVRVSAQYFVPIRCNGPEASGAISITFDDGPLPGKTEKILGILKEFNAPSAFFCIGNRVQKNPELVTRIHEEGHIIGNHSFSHSNKFDLQSANKMSLELMAADEALQSILHIKPRFFRPPYGVTNPNLATAIEKGGYTTIGWSVRSFDTMTTDPQKLLNRVTRKIRAGDIVLFHDHCDSTIAILPEFLKHVSKLGLKVVRVDQLLNENPYV